MARDLFARYVWIVDTISRYGRISRADLSRLWAQSPLSNGEELPERTFHNYRRRIEENFHIAILCTSAGEYYIDDSASESDRALSRWLVDSYAVRAAMSEASDVTQYVMVEEVPSAREFLPTALEAIRQRRNVTFTYAGFNRSRAEERIAFSPYCVRLYRQRWYMVGRRLQSGDIRTYALDRVKEMQISAETFEMPADVAPEEYFANLVGITSSKAEPHRVRLQTTPTQAKYLRALPLHPTQREEIHDFYSIFTYELKLNYELVHEILSWGSAVKVLAPAELRLMVLEELKATLRLYTE